MFYLHLNDVFLNYFRELSSRFSSCGTQLLFAVSNYDYDYCVWGGGMKEGQHIWPYVLYWLKLLQEGEDKDIGLLVSVFWKYNANART